MILVAIATNLSPTADIARQAGISILELARIVTTPRNLEDLDRVRQLHAIERDMLLGRLKREALMRLAELTDEVGASSADEVRACEVMRKACVDLLRYGGLNTEKNHSKTGRPGSGGYHPDPITPAFEAEVLEALEKLGEERIEDELLPVTQTKLATRTDAPEMPGMPGPPGPPYNESIKQGQSRHCPCHPAGGHEVRDRPGTKHGSVSLDQSHPP